MKRSLLSIALIAVLGIPALLRADILVLKNGDKMEGNILSETPDAVLMRYRLTPKIWDEKTVPRADIQEIIKQRPEEIEIVELRKVLPTPDLLTADKYEQIIQDKLRPFVNKYPGTPQAAEVQKIIDELQAEKEKVSSGQIKMEGNWVSSEVVKRDDYNIQGYILRKAMLEKAAANDYVGALREFDKLSDPVNGYPASIHFAKAIPEAIELLTKYEAQISKMLAEQPILAKQREDQLKRLVEPDLSKVKAAIDREVQGWKSTWEAEKRVRVKWLTPYKYDAKSLQEVVKTIVTEKTRLQGIDTAKLQAQNEALTAALRYLADENAIEAEAALNKAQESALKDFSRVVQEIRSRIAKLKADLAARKRTQRAFGSGTSAITGSSAPIEDDRVAKALEEASMAKKGGEPDASKTDDDKAKPDGKAATPKQPAPKPAKAASSTSSDSEPSASAEEEGGIQKYLMIGAGALILILLVTLLMQKKKS